MKGNDGAWKKKEEKSYFRATCTIAWRYALFKNFWDTKPAEAADAFEAYESVACSATVNPTPVQTIRMVANQPPIENNIS